MKNESKKIKCPDCNGTGKKSGEKCKKWSVTGKVDLLLDQPTLKASTFAIRTSQRTDQKLEKSLLCQRRQNCFYKIPNASKKNKNTPTYSPKITADNDTKTQY